MSGDPTLLRLFLGVVGLALALAIVFLVRRDRLHGGYAPPWLLVALASVMLGFFPRSIDWLAAQVGVSYPPMLLVLLGLVFVALKLLINDIERSRLKRELRVLTQRLAVRDALRDRESAD